MTPDCWNPHVPALLVIRSSAFGNSVMFSVFPCLLKAPAILSIVDHLAERRRIVWPDFDQIFTATPRQIQCALQCQNSKLTTRVVNESDFCRCDSPVDSGWHHSVSTDTSDSVRKRGDDRPRHYARNVTAKQSKYTKRYPRFSPSIRLRIRV